MNDPFNNLCFSPPSNAVGQQSRPYVVAFIKCDVMSVASGCVRVSFFTVLFYVSPTWLLLDRGPK